MKLQPVVDAACMKQGENAKSNCIVGLCICMNVIINYMHLAFTCIHAFADT